VPAAQRAYRSKPALAADLVAHLLDGGRVQAAWVGGDAAYGNSSDLRQALEARQQAYVLDVGPALGLHVADPTPAGPPVGGAAGRPPRRLRPTAPALPLPVLLAQVPATAWRTYTYRTGRKGPLQRQAVLVPVWRWEAERQQAQALHLLLSRALDGTGLKYSLCYAPPGAPALSVAQALWRQMQRYWIERLFQEAKQQLGLHQNQTRHWPAWQHHVALTMMALHFLLEAQLEGHETIPYLSFASLKLLLAQKLQNLLQQDDAWLAAIQKRAGYTTQKPPPKAPP
jgi:SRSO17 transposase